MSRPLSLQDLPEIPPARGPLADAADAIDEASEILRRTGGRKLTPAEAARLRHELARAVNRIHQVLGNLPSK